MDKPSKSRVKGIFLLVIIGIIVLIIGRFIFNFKVLFSTTTYKENTGLWENILLPKLNGFQMILILIIGCLFAMRGATLGQRLVIFLLVGGGCVWLINFLTRLSLVAVLFVKEMQLEMVFCLTMPFFILFSFCWMHTQLELIASLGGILLSLGSLYEQLLCLLMPPKYYNSKWRSKQQEGLKVKNIFVWLIVILLNLYTLLVLIQFNPFSSVEHFISSSNLNFESGVDLLYYLVVTFTTVGFGDISPHTMLAKLVTIVISMTGMLFTALFAGVIISEHH